MRKRWFLLDVVLVAALLTVACEQKPEVIARDAIAAASGFLRQAQVHHGTECIAKCDPAVVTTIQDPKLCSKICNSINDAVRAHGAAIDALNVYCGGDGWNTGGPCNPSGNRLNRDNLQSSIRSLNAVIAQVKEIVK